MAGIEPVFALCHPDCAFNASAMPEWFRSREYFLKSAGGECCCSDFTSIVSHVAKDAKYLTKYKQIRQNIDLV